MSSAGSPAAPAPRVLSIQSHVVSGYVGNRAAVFPMQMLGLDVSALNSVQFATHTGYPNLCGERLTGESLASLINALAKNRQLNHDFLVTGYIGSATFLRQVLDTRARLPRARYICDPVLGDDGPGLYVPEELVHIYREEVMAVADIVTPNSFELAHLAGGAGEDRPIDTIAAAIAAIDRVHERGPAIVVLTSLVCRDSPDELRMVASKRKEDGSVQKFVVRAPRLPRQFTGTGDLTTALLLAHLHLTDDDLKTALERTVSTVQVMVADTARYPDLQFEGESRTTPPELRVIENRHCIVDPEVRFPAQPLDEV